MSGTTTGIALSVCFPPEDMAKLAQLMEENARLRAKVSELLKVKEAAESALADTERHPLLVGFVHGPITRKELQDRLDLIAGGLTVQLNAYSEWEKINADK